MEKCAQPAKRALAGLESHKLNALNGILMLGAKPRNAHDSEPSPPAKRLDLIKSYAKDCVASAEDAAASQVAQRFAPRPDTAAETDEDRMSTGPLVSPLLALASGARTLAAALIAVALLPNLVLAALLWYGAIEPRWPSAAEPPPEQSQALASQSQVPVIRSVVTTPILLMPPQRDATEADEVTSGEVTSALPAMQGASAPEQAGQDAAPLPGGQRGRTESSEDEEAQALAAATPQEAIPAALAEPVPLPTRKPAPPSADDGDASWVKPTAYVNLRSAPSSGASVVAVVAKGAKMRVVARKRGWIQATDPATSNTGWIYSGNVTAAR